MCNGVEKRYGRNVHALKGVDLQVSTAGRCSACSGLTARARARSSSACSLSSARPHADRHAAGQPHRAQGRRSHASATCPSTRGSPSTSPGRQVVGVLRSRWRRCRATCCKKAHGRTDRPGRCTRTTRTERSAGTPRACSSASAWRRRWSTTRTWSSSMSRPTASTPSADATSARCSRQIRERGKTVFVNSHLLSELEAICDRVAILVSGQGRPAGQASTT